MKKIILAAVLTVLAAPAFAAVGVSVNIGEPGFYGRIDIGNDYGSPRLVRSQPVVIERTRVVEQPVYLRVPSGHQKNWKRYCGRYDACNRPVYFVRDDWYRDVYSPRYREHHGNGHDDHGRGHDDHDRGHNDHHDDHRDDHRDNHDRHG